MLIDPNDKDYSQSHQMDRTYQRVGFGIVSGFLLGWYRKIALVLGIMGQGQMMLIYIYISHCVTENAL